MEKRVVVTGIGVISPAGCNKEVFWQGIANGISFIDDITYFDTSKFEVKKAAEIKYFDPDCYISKKEQRRMDLFEMYGVAAALDAKYDAGLDYDKETKKGNYEPERTGVIVGSGFGGGSSILEQVSNLIKKGPSKVSPYTIIKIIIDMAAGHISKQVYAKKDLISIVTACASSTHNIGEAFRKIKDGYLDTCFTGGIEATIDPFCVAAFQNMGALSKKGISRPFDLERDGFIMGEGTGILVLESLENAIKRNAKIYGEIIGYGATADAFHETQPDSEGMKRCMVDSIEEANIEKEQIGYINAHGTSTKQNDAAETLAIKKAFGKHAYNLYVNSTKSLIGHCLGAAGALELIATLLQMNNGIIHPTINYKTKDPECDLNYVPNEAIEEKVEYALSNSFGFGGKNASIIVKGY